MKIPRREKGEADMHTRQGGRLDSRGGISLSSLHNGPVRRDGHTKELNLTVRPVGRPPSPEMTSWLLAPPPSQKPPSALY